MTDELGAIHAKLAHNEALLFRTELERLGWGRAAVDKIFRELPTIHVNRRPMIRVGDYLAYLEEHTYRDNRVRPAA